MIDKIKARLLLSKAKHPSLRGHANISRAVARMVPAYEYGEAEFFATDNAPADVVQRRREAFQRLATTLREKAPKTLEVSKELEDGLSDVAFVNSYRVPFQFQRYVAQHLRVGCVAAATEGPRVRDLDGNWSYDLSGAYGVNLFGHEFYKGAMERGFAAARDLGVLLGTYNPIIADNVRRLKDVSAAMRYARPNAGTTRSPANPTPASRADAAPCRIRDRPACRCGRPRAARRKLCKPSCSRSRPIAPNSVRPRSACRKAWR